MQLPQLKSVLPHPKYKSLCDCSTQYVICVLSTLSTGLSCMSFFPLHAQNNWFCKPYADKSVPANNSTPSKVLDRKTKTFDGVELFAGTDLSA